MRLTGGWVRVAIVGSIVAVLAAGCSSRCADTSANAPASANAGSAAAAASTAAAAPELTYPPGVVPAANAAAAKSEGLYPANGSETCCFLNGSPTLLLNKPAGSATVTFTFYVPDTAPFASQPERIEMWFDGVPVPAVEVPKGLHDVTVTLPAPLPSRGQITATMRMSTAYVPKVLGLNDDARQLSIMLTKVRYK